ncbi:uncharacterized protein LOC119610739 isoform X2 [Lucilia sericata]|uniref:uncharacterized protein LOC119610739 isoform X2 n=1 Tax=Lucilia sericata TaxID=13632 RepID=UPI0018A853F0|nr:uncharacterized protein LOC119610739 isoform X2 [Lucilia sericata]
MSDQYMKELLRVAVAQICQTIGYNATQSAPLELLQDVLDKFMREFTRDLRRQVEHYNRTEANLNDVTLTLSSINVNLNELLDYINNVEPVPFALDVPKFPARKDSALNFLKPGSKEVLTRPVHVHAHLPPMLPPEITQQPAEPLALAGSSSNSGSNSNLSDSKTFQDNLTASANNANGEATNENSAKSLNSSTVLDKTTLHSLFKPSTNLEDGERPTREVSSVVMTTGGYISPAVEGKMPEAIVPDIIDKLLGLDAPPPPPPPPAPPTQSRPASRSANSTPNPLNNENSSALAEKDGGEREIATTTSKESKKQALARSLEPQPVTHKKTELLADLPNMKKHKLFNASGGKNFHPDLQPQPVGNFNKKSFMMHQNNSGALQTPQTNYANMLLKKAKKQKVPLLTGQPLNEKHAKPLGDKMGKMDAADKAHRKYMKMLQKMAKQGKIPPELLSNIMGPDKKSKQINPAIVASMPPGPERLQLEKLLRKQAKQRQKLMKQQMLMEVQKQSKKPIQQPPPLVPIFPPRMSEATSKPLALDMDEQKLKMEGKDMTNVSPVKPQFTPNIVSNTTPTGHQLPEALVNKFHKTPIANEAPPIELMDNNAKPLLTADGKELKLSNEPDRSKLNIFKKISKQKTPKPSSPTPMRLPGLNDTPIINLPSGTTITPAPGPSQPANASAPSLGRNLFPPLNDTNNTALNSGNIINVDDIKDKPVASTPTNQINPQQPADLSLLNRVFGEKPPEVELINKPKKRGRKPGSKNSPKIPGQFPNSMLKKNSKKMKLDNSHLFPGQIPSQLPPGFGAAGGMGNLSFDNMAQLFGNPLNPLEWAQNKHLQQQMMIMAGAKERKEHKKKSKLLKQDLLNNDNSMASLNMTNPATNMAVPTNEEVQSINKKLMRMDTILKAAPSSSSTTDLSVDTSLITGKKLPSPAIFPSVDSSASSTSPLKSPGNSKRLLAGAEAMASSLVQPFMLPNRPAFPNLPTNMLSMLQFPFPPRPGLIPTPGLFPTPGLGAFPNNPKNPLLPGLFPFPNLKQPMGSENAAVNQEDLTTDKKKSDTNIQAAERSYCNVAPLVPDFLTKLNEQQQHSGGCGNKHSHEPPHAHEPDLPKTPKPRNSHSNTLTHDNLLKKMQDAHTPESAGGSISGKSIPSTPGGMSLNTFEQLMKKNESPMDLMALNKHNKSLSQSQESGLDFSMNKKSNHNMGGGGGGGNMGGLSIKTPITLNNEPIEVSDDSDETNQPPPPPSTAKTQATATTHLPSQPSQAHAASTHHSSFNMDDMFVANTSNNSHMPPKPLDTDLSTKELKKLKKQVKKSSSSINATSLISADKSDGGLATGTGNAGGVGKLAGGADLIPLTSTGMAYSSKNIPYNSLTANANPTFNAHKNDFTNTSASTSAAAATSSSSVFDNLTITAAIPSSSGASSSTVYDLQKKRKEHKKLKKLKELKEGKIKKKKDKKDKNKSKEKAEKYLLTHTQSSPVKEKEQPTIEIIPTAVAPAPVMAHTATTNSSNTNSEKVKDKDLLKKLKKEKKKEKLRTNLDDHHHSTQQTPNSLQQQASVSNPLTGNTKETISSSSATGPLSLDIEPTKKQKLSPAALMHTSSSGHVHNETTSNTTTATAPAAIVPKLTLKLGSTHSPTPPRDDGHKNSSTSASLSSSAAPVQPPPPSAVSSPPREHQREPSPELARISPLVTRPPKHKLNTSGELSASSSTASNSISAANASSLEIGDVSKASSASNPNLIVPPPSPWLSGGTISASSVLLPHQLLQTTKQHDMTTAPSSTAHHSTDTASKTTNADRQSPLTLITETSRPSSYIMLKDAEGNRVWICPACGKVDDGSPMIGCDGCDAWYHWVCVGIFVAPKDNEDWFCRVCITRKKGLHGSDKKRKRNKKK